MSKNTNPVAQYVETLAQDARSLIAATSDVAEENVKQARKRLATALNSGGEIYDRAREEAVVRAKIARETVKENPVASIAIALIVAGVFAFLLGRRRE
ncbi:MAG: DUF883 family protein [Terrimicrobiaceae bacterium]